MIFPHAPEVTICRSKRDIVVTVANLLNSRITTRLDQSGIFHLALTGGSLGRLISKLLVAQWNEEPDKYAGLHLWWGDERFVSELSQDRNADPVTRGLREGSLIHVHQSLPSDPHVELEVAAKRYSLDLLGIDMDITLLGVGSDGHVASLFPGQWEEGEERDVIAVHDSPKPPPQRISFSMSKIKTSRAVWLVINGVEKHEAFSKIIARDPSIPATYAQGKIETLLFTEKEALQGE
jgi:6-phosphogluconolactonase